MTVDQTATHWNVASICCHIFEKNCSVDFITSNARGDLTDKSGIIKLACVWRWEACRPTRWSVYDLVMADDPRTTNFLEGWLASIVQITFFIVSSSDQHKQEYFDYFIWLFGYVQIFLVEILKMEAVSECGWAVNVNFDFLSCQSTVLLMNVVSTKSVLSTSSKMYTQQTVSERDSQHFPCPQKS